MNEDLRDRDPEEVFEDHLRLAAEHRFDEDIDRNVAPAHGVPVRLGAG